MSLSDLTGTKWVLNSSLSSYAGGSYTIKYYNVNITTDEATYGINAANQATDTFVDIAIGYSGGTEKNEVWFGISGIVLSHLFAIGHDTKTLPDAWDQVLTIPFTITGGTDATNSALISWLESNATQSITPVDILLGSSSIASLSTTGSVTLATQNTYLANDITVSFTKTIGSATTPSSTIYATPTISVSSSGLITATVTQSQSITPIVTPGYISSGTAGTVTVSVSNIKQLTTQAAQTITPTTTNQTIASGKYLTGVQTILGDANLLAENIKKDVVIFGITGTYEGDVPSGYTVTISLTNPSHPNSFLSCRICEALSNVLYDDGNNIGSISSPTGSTEITVSASVYGISVYLDGTAIYTELSNCTCTGGVTVEKTDYAGAFLFSVSGNGTITIDGVEYAD